jgi:ABC-type amino acid transport substrate-binding protein
MAKLDIDWFLLSVAAALGCAPAHQKTLPATAPPASAPAVASAAPVAPSSSSAQRPLLRVGISGDYAPFATTTNSATPAGFDVDLAKAAAQDLGFEVAWVTFRWPELAERVQSNAFDVAMSGVTWQPQRDVTGYMTRTVAHGGPCVLGDPQARRIAVNHGGILESWARGKFGQRELVVVDDNQSLPNLLASGTVGAIVTDSFERRAFQRPGVASQCEPALAQKVYWVTPLRSAELAPRLDAWLEANASRVQEAQRRWFGESQPLTATRHLVDLIARRFAFMPLVAGLKLTQNLPIEDKPRELEVLEATRQSARKRELPEAATLELFRLQIELSKAVQRRQNEPSTLDLGKQIRPALSSLGDRILAALVHARPTLGTLTSADLEALSPWLGAGERQQLLAALQAVAK